MALPNSNLTWIENGDDIKGTAVTGDPGDNAGVNPNLNTPLRELLENCEHLEASIPGGANGTLVIPAYKLGLAEVSSTYFAKVAIPSTAGEMVLERVTVVVDMELSPSGTTTIQVGPKSDFSGDYCEVSLGAGVVENDQSDSVDCNSVALGAWLYFRITAAGTHSNISVIATLIPKT